MYNDELVDEDVINVWTVLYFLFRLPLSAQPQGVHGYFFSSLKDCIPDRFT